LGSWKGGEGRRGEEEKKGQYYIWAHPIVNYCSIQWSLLGTNKSTIFWRRIMYSQGVAKMLQYTVVPPWDYNILEEDNV